MVTSEVYSTAFGIDRTANTDLTWETTTQYNLGLDFSFLKNKISATLDLYHKLTEDLLLFVDYIPSDGAASRALINIGSVENKGIEFALNTVNFRSKDFAWITKFNISANRNEIIKLADSNELFFDVNAGWHLITNEVRLSEGGSIGDFFGYATSGVLGQDENGVANDLPAGLIANGPGSRIFIDQPTIDTDNDGVLEPDGVIDADDRVVIGSPLPKHFGGITNRFRYKNVDLSALVNWSYGNDVYNANRVYFEGIHNSFNRTTAILDAWTPDNQETDIVALQVRDDQNSFVDRYVEDASYIRLKNITCGYNFSSKRLRNTPFKKIRIYASGQNLFTITGYKGYNPDASVTRSQVTPGVDWGAYPLARVFTVGLNATF